MVVSITNDKFINKGPGRPAFSIENRIKFPVQDAGGDIEDEANAKAGEMIKIFAKSKPERKRIYESLIYSTV